MKSLCVLVSLLAVVYGFTFKAPGKECTNISQCQPGECCQIMSEFEILSKRRVATNGIMPIKRTGTCEPYKLEGDSCGIFARANGYCSCEPGTRCWNYEVKVSTAKPMPHINYRLSRRDMMPSMPGYQWISKCTKFSARP